MTDLINKVNSIEVNGIQELYNKYQPILGTIKDIPQLPYFIYSFDIGFNYIKEKHLDLSSDWKTWSMVCFKQLYFKGLIKNESDIIIEIDKFVEHYRNDYDAFIRDTAMFTSEYYRDYAFVFEYTFKRKG